MVLITVPLSGGTDNTVVIMGDYRFDPIRWAYWKDYSLGCLAPVVDSGSPSCFAGTNDGYVVRMFHRTRSIAGGTAIAYKVTTPHLTYGEALIMKTMLGGSIGILPKSGGDVTFGWTRDDKSQDTTTITQGGSDLLDTASSNRFTLGTSTLGGSRFVDRFFSAETGGEFRTIQFQVTQSTVDEDYEMHTLSALVTFGEPSMQN